MKDNNVKEKQIKEDKVYKLDLRGGEVPYKEGNAAAVDFRCPQDVILNMPWMRMGRGHVNLRIGLEMPKDIGLDIRSRSGFSDKGLLCNVAYIDENDNQVGYMTQVRADVEMARLGLVDSDYRGDIGALYRVNSERYMPTKDSKFKLNADYLYHVFVIPKGTRICQGAFRKVENLDYVLGELDMTTDRGGGYGHGGVE